MRLVKLNAADWPYLVAGGIAACIAGCAGPMFAVIYSSMMKVHTSNIISSAHCRVCASASVCVRARACERVLKYVLIVFANNKTHSVC